MVVSANNPLPNVLTVVNQSNTTAPFVSHYFLHQARPFQVNIQINCKIVRKPILLFHNPIMLILLGHITYTKTSSHLVIQGLNPSPTCNLPLVPILNTILVDLTPMLATQLQLSVMLTILHIRFIEDRSRNISTGHPTGDGRHEFPGAG